MYNRATIRKLFFTAVTLVLAIVVCVIFRRTWNTPYDRVSTELHSDQRIGVKPARETPKAVRLFDQEGTLQRRLPQFIIIGIMKCGTRALITYLELHPDIVTVKPEINYFNLHYDNGQEWYRNQMPLSKPGQVTTEKSPKYYEAVDVPKRIHAMNASIKIILIVRNPVDRSVSHWLHRCFKAREANKTLAICQKYEDSGILTSEGDVNTTNTFIFRSSYIKSIENWTRWLRHGTQLHIVDGHKLVSDPVSELEKVETFLGLRHHITQKNLVFNKKRGFYCMISKQGKERCLGKNKGVKHPNLNREVEEKLRTYFNPLNQLFYRAVGRDFGWS